jgi:ribonuclease P protein subunit RPR2
MAKRRYAKPQSLQRIAKERISLLFRQAGKEFRRHPERSKRYVELARRIGMRYNVRIPKNLRRKFCPKCFSYLKPGVNCRVRAREEKQAVAVTCMVCGFVSRHPYIREKQNIKR